MQKIIYVFLMMLICILMSFAVGTCRYYIDENRELTTTIGSAQVEAAKRSCDDKGGLKKITVEGSLKTGILTSITVECFEGVYIDDKNN